MRLVEVWRFPVKSVQGERLESIAVTPSGLEGDRRFAIFDSETGYGLTARRIPQLLYASARLLEDGGVEITLPDGTIAANDAALSRWLGRPVTLRSSDEDVQRRYEDVAEVEDDNASVWEPFDGSPGAFHDSAGASVSLVSLATIGAWDRRRFRTNLVVDDPGEDALVGSQVSVGDAVLDVGMRLDRCVMTTRPQPGGIDRDLDVLRTIHRERQGYLAVGAVVRQVGTVRVGDMVTAT
jgi:uncharacterized protein YcbX